jgi:hypothetical protein
MFLRMPPVTCAPWASSISGYRANLPAAHVEKHNPEVLTGNSQVFLSKESYAMEKFFAAVRNMFSVPDLRRRIFFTLGLLAVYRLGAHIPAPGINKDQLERVWNDVGNTLLGVLDLFSGGNLRTISIFALGVMPYITASIILQLMTGRISCA